MGVLFDVHVFELARLEDLAALFAFDEFGVFVAAYDLDLQVFARLLHIRVLRGDGRLGRHISGMCVRDINCKVDIFTGNFRYFRTALPLVKPLTVTPS